MAEKDRIHGAADVSVAKPESQRLVPVVEIDNVQKETGAAAQEVLEIEKQSLEKLSADLGFQETPAMREIKGKVIALMRENGLQKVASLEAYARLGSEYHILAEAEIDALPDGDPRIKAQIGFMLASACIWRDAEDKESFESDINAAADSAYQNRWDDLVAKIEAFL